MIEGRSLVGGRAEGVALVLDEPLSFWGGVHAETGEIIDRHHPQLGASVADVVLVVGDGRGSSSGSSVIAELIRIGRAPAAIVVGYPDQILVLGAIVAGELYPERPCPIVQLSEQQLSSIRTGDRVIVEGNGVWVRGGGERQL